MKINNVSLFSGTSHIRTSPLPVFSDIACEFLNNLSTELKKIHGVSDYPDILSLSFFCRKGNIARLKLKYQDGKVRVGRGLAFHIAPSNVPINFAYSYVFGLLSGNANIVRVSAKKEFPQIKMVCDAINSLFENLHYKEIKERTAIISYDINKDITDEISAFSDVRVVWGGNNTINEIRKSLLKPRGIEVSFADRYSFAIIDASSVLRTGSDELNVLANNFYNDTYLMDQNACSSPHLIVWLGTSKKDRQKAQIMFWDKVNEIAARYDLTESKVTGKYAKLCAYIATSEDIVDICRYKNTLNVITLNNLPVDITVLRGLYGMFFQYEANALCDLDIDLNETIQTCLYYGVNKEDIIEYIVNNRFCGVDRVVPFGKALDIGIEWDGYDVVGSLSRIIV